jgi:DUF4097 and DUF4098 domain-containing protein YvlB
MRRETFETPGELTLEVRVPTGRIEIEAFDGTTTEVELDVRGGDEAAELLEEARIELRESRGGHEVVVEVESRRWSRLWRRLDIRLRIVAPEGANLRLSTASGDLRARGRLGWLEAEAASGDMEVDELSGDATVKAASGDVSLATVGGAANINTASGDIKLGYIAGDLAVKAASGDVTVSEARGDATISTASGDQRIEAVTAGKVDLKSMSGDIKIGIRQGSNVWVDARAMSGDLSSEVALGDEPPAEDAPLVELRAASMSGDIEVVRAAAASMPAH